MHVSKIVAIISTKRLTPSALPGRWRISSRLLQGLDPSPSTVRPRRPQHFPGSQHNNGLFHLQQLSAGSCHWTVHVLPHPERPRLPIPAIELGGMGPRLLPGSTSRPRSTRTRSWPLRRLVRICRRPWSRSTLSFSLPCSSCCFLSIVAPVRSFRQQAEWAFSVSTPTSCTLRVPFLRLEAARVWQDMVYMKPPEDLGTPLSSRRAESYHEHTSEHSAKRQRQCLGH